MLSAYFHIRTAPGMLALVHFLPTIICMRNENIINRRTCQQYQDEDMWYQDEDMPVACPYVLPEECTRK